MSRFPLDVPTANNGPVLDHSRKDSWSLNTIKKDNSLDSKEIVKKPTHWRGHGHLLHSISAQQIQLTIYLFKNISFCLSHTHTALMPQSICDDLLTLASHRWMEVDFSAMTAKVSPSLSQSKEMHLLHTYTHTRYPGSVSDRKLVYRCVCLPREIHLVHLLSMTVEDLDGVVGSKYWTDKKYTFPLFIKQK